MRKTKKKQVTQQISASDFAKKIVAAIKEEPYIDENVIVPKIKVLIRLWAFKLNAVNYNKILNPNKTTQLIRDNELKTLELDFWHRELKQIVGEDGIKEYYEKRDQQRKIWRGENE